MTIHNLSCIAVKTRNVSLQLLNDCIHQLLDRGEKSATGTVFLINIKLSVVRYYEIKDLPRDSTVQSVLCRLHYVLTQQPSNPLMLEGIFMLLCSYDLRRLVHVVNY